MSSELEKIALLSRRFSGHAPGVDVAIGDDAAVLSPAPGKRLVWTVDTQVEGVHFRRDLVSGWRDVGWRSFMAAASDVAAMGAAPWCALSALELPDAIDDAALDAMAEGQRAAAERVGAPIVGGNLSRAPVVAITTTVLGTVDTAIGRRGARPGDGVWIAGPVGLAAAGLSALEQRLHDPRVEPAVVAWRTPEARIADGLAMAGAASAAIDISDGLARDLGHVARASGVRVLLDEAALLAHCGETLAHAAEAVGARPLELALRGGEDYALVVASLKPIPGFSRIGEIVSGDGLALVTAAGTRPIDAAGYDHFGG